MAAPLIEPHTELTEEQAGTKKTTELRTGDRVTTPAGDRIGTVRNTYPGGFVGKDEGVTTVKFIGGTVRNTDPDNTERPRTYVFDVDDDADWQVWRYTS